MKNKQSKRKRLQAKTNEVFFDILEINKMIIVNYIMLGESASCNCMRTKETAKSEGITFEHPYLFYLSKRDKARL